MNRRQFLSRAARLYTGAAAASLLPHRAAHAAAAPASRPAAGPLRVHAANPRYFADPRGNPVYLTGSHTWNSLVDMSPTDPPLPFGFAAYLDWMGKLGHNFMRLWNWELVTWNTKGNNPANRKTPRLHTVAPHPWMRVGPGRALDGKPKFNLERFNPDYFTRLRERVIAARARGIYTAVMLFEGWGLQFSPGAWESHPFHPANNVNNLDPDTNRDGKGLELQTLGNVGVGVLQRAYLRKVVDTVNDLDNVLYEVANEAHAGSTEWQYFAIDFVREYERQKLKQHPIGMTYQYRGGTNRTLFDSPADWISPNNQGGYRDDPPAAKGRKVILSDTDHLWGIGGNQAWVWKSFLRGLNPIFMDSYDGLVLGDPFDPKWDPIRKSMGYTRRFAQRINLAALTPRPELTTTRYCLAQSGLEYLVYLPAGGKTTVDLRVARGELAVEWFDPSRNATHTAGTIDGKARREFKAPFDGDAVLYLLAIA